MSQMNAGAGATLVEQPVLIPTYIALPSLQKSGRPFHPFPISVVPSRISCTSIPIHRLPIALLSTCRPRPRAMEDDAPIMFSLPEPAAVGGDDVAVAPHHEDQTTTQEEEAAQMPHEADAAALLEDAVVPHLPSPQDYHNSGVPPAATEAEMTSAPPKRDAEEAVATLNQEEPKRQKTSSAAAVVTTSPNKKERREFTVEQKLRILHLLEGGRQASGEGADGNVLPQTLTNKQIREKFGVSKSSLHRWRQQKQRLQIMVQSDGLGTRKRDTKDPLEKVKSRLQKFYNENMAKAPDERLFITTPVVQAMACKIRDELLAEYDAAVADAAAAAAIDLDDGQEQEQDQPPEPNLNEEELMKIRGFKVTKSWAGRVASQMGWLSQPRKKSSNSQEQQGGGQVVDEQMAPVAHNEAADIVNTAPNDTIAASTEEDDDATEKAKLNTMEFLSKTHPDYSASNPKAKKARKEFSAVEKLAILEEMDPEKTANPMVMADICEKYSTSKSSVFRWKQQYRAGTLTQMINEEGRGAFKRDVVDKLGKIKIRLKKYIEENRAQPPETREALSSGVLQGKAQQFRDELLAQHNLDPSKSDLKDDEVDALQRFKASKGWARKAAARYGWTETEDPNYSVEAAMRTEAAVLRTEAAAAIAAASVAAAEVSVDVLMEPVSVPQLTRQVAAGSNDTAMIQQPVEHQDQHEHEDAVNEAMHSMLDGDLASGPEEQFHQV